MRTLPLAEDVTVTVAWDEHGPGQFPMELADLPAYLVDRAGDASFWATVEGGTVVRLDEQYRP